MSSELITAHFFTNQHRVRGQIFTGVRRLTDVLNDELYSYVELRDTEVARVIEPEKVVYSHSSMILMKEAIVFALLTGERRDGREMRISQYVDKKIHDVLITLPSYEISGRLHLRVTEELATLLIREAGHFIPLTQAQVIFALYPRVKFSGDVAIVNKRLMEVIGLESPDTIP